MSLISPRNFVAPLTNPINLATIIVIAVLFAIYRLSGGGVSISSRKAPPAPEPVAVQAPRQPSLLDIEEQPVAKSQAAKPVTQDNTLGALLNNSKKDSLRDPPKQAPTPSKNKNSIDDIAKQLGVH